jgi:hypothetical protein
LTKIAALDGGGAGVTLCVPVAAVRRASGRRPGPAAALGGDQAAAVVFVSADYAALADDRPLYDVIGDLQA